jgi:phage terminase large subunit
LGSTPKRGSKREFIPPPPGIEPREWSKNLKAARTFMDRYRFDPSLFAEEILRVKLDPWQIEANAAIADYVKWQYRRDNELTVQKPPHVRNWFTVKAMHGPGKTFWGATLICWFGSVFPDSRIPCVAPKLEQLKTRLFLELKKVRSGATPDFQAWTADIGSLFMKWAGDDGWLAFGQTATHAENLAGLHNDFMLLFVDEASGVAESLFPTLLGALSTGKIIIFVMIGNPSKNVGTFAQSWLKPNIAKLYHHVNITLDKAPRVSAQWVQMMRDKYGPESPVVKIRCLGEFADDNALQLIPTAHLLAAHERDCPDFSGEQTKLRISIDVADGGVDETVIGAGRSHMAGRTMLRIKRFSFPSSVAPLRAADAGVNMFEAFGGRRGVDEFVVDGLGVGAGCAGRLIELGHRVVVHKGGESASDKAKWRNRRVQNYCALRDVYADGELTFSPDCFEDENDVEELNAQLASIEMNPGTDRVDDLVTKEQMKANGIKSPDMADMLSMQYSTAQSAQQGLMDYTRLKAEEAKQPESAVTTGPAALMGQRVPLSASPLARDLPVPTNLVVFATDLDGNRT